MRYLSPLRSFPISFSFGKLRLFSLSEESFGRQSNYFQEKNGASVKIAGSISSQNDKKCIHFRIQLYTKDPVSAGFFSVYDFTERFSLKKTCLLRKKGDSRIERKRFSFYSMQGKMILVEN